MKKTEQLVKAPNTTMYFPKAELSMDELNRLYVIGHVVPSWLRMIMVNTDMLDRYLEEPPKRDSKKNAIDKFIQDNTGNMEILHDVEQFSNGELDLLDLSVKYGLFYKDIKQVFKQCLPDEDIDTYWKNHKKESQKKTTMSLYGVTHTSKDKTVADKKRKTMIERYGVEHNMQSPELRDSFKQNMLDKHGVEYAYQLSNKHLIDNWYHKLFHTLSQDSDWEKVLQLICESNDWVFNESIFEPERLNIRHRDFILGENIHDNIDTLLQTYNHVIGTVIYPDNVIFNLPIGTKFNSTWLRHYEKAGLISINEESISNNGKVSKYERMVMNIFDNNDISYVVNHRKTLDGKEMDFYLEDYNIGIEINPNCTHNSNDYATTSSRTMYDSYKEPSYHYNKYKLAQSKDITLIQWFADDLSDERFHTITVPRLLSMIKGYSNRIYARKTIVSKANRGDIKEIKDFINKYHSQHNAPATEYWGFWYNDILVAAASFTIKGDSAELKRLCFQPDTQIVGGVSKLIKTFFSEHPDIKRVTSFSDNNLGNGNGYAQAGAEFKGETGPSLKYISWSDPTDTYSWAIATPWGAKSGVVAKDSNYKDFATQADINQYVECELSHRTDGKCGYDKIYTAGSKKWEFKR